MLAVCKFGAVFHSIFNLDTLNKNAAIFKMHIRALILAVSYTDVRERERLSIR